MPVADLDIGHLPVLLDLHGCQTVDKDTQLWKTEKVVWDRHNRKEHLTAEVKKDQKTDNEIRVGRNTHHNTDSLDKKKRGLDRWTVNGEVRDMRNHQMQEWTVSNVEVWIVVLKNTRIRARGLSIERGLTLLTRHPRSIL